MTKKKIDKAKVDQKKKKTIKVKKREESLCVDNVVPYQSLRKLYVDNIVPKFFNYKKKK